MSASTFTKFGQRAKNRLKEQVPTPSTLWRYKVRAWLKQWPERLLRKTSLAKLVEAQVQARTQALFRQANYDTLTHLPNRNYFTATLEDTLTRAENEDAAFALLFLDLDGFKPVNDTYGHAAGDELLRLVAARLVASVREDDFVARLGGDEFVILLRDLVDEDIIQTISKRLIHEVSRPYWVDGRAVQVSTSVGIAEFPSDGKTAAQVMERADQALYAAKHRGRKQFCFYRDVASDAKVAPDHLQTHFEVDVEHQKFIPCFRRVEPLSAAEDTFMRMNVRWQDAPIENDWYEGWQPLLARSQWSTSMGLWMVETAAWYLAQWRSPSTGCSVPLDTALLLQESVADLLAQRVESYGAKPEQLILSVDIDAVNRLDLKAVEVLDALKKKGFKLRLQGFGSRTIEPALFAHLQIDYLAINWVDALRFAGQLEKRLRWLEGLVAWGHALGARVLVDDLDDVEALQAMQAIGVDAVEGAVIECYHPGEESQAA
ncbi:diguanylate cyclase (GGDEF) domain-containing protein [Sulfurivirga caldicuralii]|uniref:Diguanylate cyclase (GGDEF) domain-containing protein n=1 Tax=Sulfurivirga caldicuralii TaxID=364032 RepID=A0A1N6DFE5_9GAMM|nr:sensor domain-containing diguanylate cyclase [Sulfurivirga caldicuralii]SIN69530.1 diguanylate cyclase (GGDEF) domain-containing protein [Sulfurivirga caldicuralii]